MTTMSTSFVNLNIDFTSSLVFFFALTVSCEIWHTTKLAHLDIAVTLWDKYCVWRWRKDSWNYWLTNTKPNLTLYGPTSVQFRTRILQYHRILIQCMHVHCCKCAEILWCAEFCATIVCKLLFSYETKVNWFLLISSALCRWRQCNGASRGSAAEHHEALQRCVTRQCNGASWDSAIECHLLLLQT